MPGGSGGSCRFGQSSGSAGSDRPSGLSGCGDGWVFRPLWSCGSGDYCESCGCVGSGGCSLWSTKL